MKIPLVLVHGWGVHSKIWNPILPLLEPDFDVTLIDLPGFGRDADYRGDFALGTITDRILGQAPPRAIWVGWSLGGTIALSAALRQPDRFMKLQLVSSTPRFLNCGDWKLGVELAPFEKLANQFERDYAKGLKKFLLLQWGHVPARQQSSVKSFVRETTKTLMSMPQPTREALDGGLAILSSTDLRTRLRNIEIATQVIAGTYDVIVPVAASEQLADSLPHSQFHQLDTGHLPFLDATSQYISHLREFAIGQTS